MRIAAPFVSAECDNGHSWPVKDDFQPLKSWSGEILHDGHHDLGETRHCPACGLLWQRLHTAPKVSK